MDIQTVIADTGGLGPIHLDLPPGRRTLTPASRIAVEAIGRHRGLLRGPGIDWGCGTGALAIAAARVATVTHVIGLELQAADLPYARRNAAANGVAEKTTFLHADSYRPLSVEDASALAAFEGRTGFLVANPPASAGDDGLGWRRAALEGARRFLVTGAPVLLQVSYQYGAERISRLADDVGGYTYEGVVHSTDWEPFDGGSEDLPVVLPQYAAEEDRGGVRYAFPDVDAPDAGHTDARGALARYRRDGRSPRTRWQIHLFRHL